MRGGGRSDVLISGGAGRRNDLKLNAYERCAGESGFIAERSSECVRNCICAKSERVSIECASPRSGLREIAPARRFGFWRRSRFESRRWGPGAGTSGRHRLDSARKMRDRPTNLPYECPISPIPSCAKAAPLSPPRRRQVCPREPNQAVGQIPRHSQKTLRECPSARAAWFRGIRRHYASFPPTARTRGEAESIDRRDYSIFPGHPKRLTANPGRVNRGPATRSMRRSPSAFVRFRRLRAYPRLYRFYRATPRMRRRAESADPRFYSGPRAIGRRPGPSSAALRRKYSSLRRFPYAPGESPSPTPHPPRESARENRTRRPPGFRDSLNTRGDAVGGGPVGTSERHMLPPRAPVLRYAFGVRFSRSAVVAVSLVLVFWCAFGVRFGRSAVAAVSLVLDFCSALVSAVPRCGGFVRLSFLVLGCCFWSLCGSGGEKTTFRKSGPEYRTWFPARLHLCNPYVSLSAACLSGFISL